MERATIHLSRLLHGEQSNFLPENLNPELLFSERGLGETALLAQKSGFPQKYVNRNWKGAGILRLPSFSLVKKREIWYNHAADGAEALCAAKRNLGIIIGIGG